MFSTLSPGDNISLALRKLLQGSRGVSGYIQVCNKGSRWSEHQRSGIKLGNLAFYVCGDASLWAALNWFLSHVSQLSGAHFVSLFTLLLAFPQCISNHLGDSSCSNQSHILWIPVLRTFINIWRPEIADGCDISCSLIWQEILSFHSPFPLS